MLLISRLRTARGRIAPRIAMAQLKPAPKWVIASTLVLAALASPAAAQFGSIFGPPPRPPSDVPYPENRRDERLPQQPQRYDPRSRQAPEPPPPPLTRLPPSRTPQDVQSQPLPPPPGAPAATQDPQQQQEAARPSGPGQPPLTGLPPGQRQPRGTPGQGAPQTDEVVVAPPKQKIVNQKAVFAGLDKITGRIISFDVNVEETVQFGALRLTPRACYTRPPSETPNTDGFVEVDEITLQGEVKRIFTGWMFAASPGLHGIEHPIYDVWLTDCKDAPQQAAAQQAEPPAAEPPPPPQQRPQQRQQQQRPPQQRPAQQRPSAQQLPPPPQ
jgi:hypothetical protein